MPPVAVTQNATNGTSTSAKLNGTAGPGVPGGDITNFFFKFGTTTAYGSTTPTGTVGSCPAGATTPAYCPGVPAAASVSDTVGNLSPCTLYHFAIVSSNPDGTTTGQDKTFTTGFAKPISSVKVNKKKVKHGKKFRVKITLSHGANVKIFLRKNGHDVKTFNLGFHGPGTFTKTIRAPHKKGTYFVRVVARTGCGKQTVNKKLKVF